MAHQIDFSNGRANMAYHGKLPWHGLGQQIDADAPLDDWRRAAGLDWHIQKRPLFFGIETENGEREPMLIENKFAHVRSDTQACIGMGSDKFKLVQPEEVLEFYRDLLDGSKFKMETLGALNGGSKLWALAQYSATIQIGERDLIKPYLLLATANDGSMATVADFTSVRVVCNNTLSLAVGNNGQKANVRIPHTRIFDADQIKVELGLVDDRIETFAQDADKLAQTRVTDEQMINYFVSLYAKKDNKGNLENERSVKNTVKKLVPLYRNGPGADLETAHGTAWGLVNATTHFIDFEMRARNHNNRFASAQLGNGKALKEKAFELALDLAA
jgi:phage/plasmid-like protein (TIGR03299 family)